MDAAFFELDLQTGKREHGHLQLATNAKSYPIHTSPKYLSNHSRSNDLHLMFTYDVSFHSRYLWVNTVRPFHTFLELAKRFLYLIIPNIMQFTLQVTILSISYLTYIQYSLLSYIDFL